MKILLGTLLALFAINVNAVDNTLVKNAEVDIEKPTDMSTYIYKDKAGQVLLTNVNPSGSFDKFTKKINVTYYEDKSLTEYQDMLKKKHDEEYAKRLEYERQLAKKPNARIGMTKDQILNKSNWGKPDDINTTIDAYGTFEQWVYGSSQYLYFKNGKLTTIQQ